MKKQDVLVLYWARPRWPWGWNALSGTQTARCGCTDSAFAHTAKWQYSPEKWTFSHSVRKWEANLGYLQQLATPFAFHCIPGYQSYFLLGYQRQSAPNKKQNKVQTCDFMLCQCKACKLIPEGKWHVIPGEIWILPCTRESVLTSWL